MKKNRFQKYILSLVGCLIFLLSFITSTKTAAALVGTPEEYNNIALLQGLETCYQGGYIKSSDVTLGDFNSSGLSALQGTNFTTDHVVIIPTKVGNTIGDSDLRCSEVFLGHTGIGGEITGLNGRYHQLDSLTEYGFVPDEAANTAVSESLSQIEIRFGVTDGSGNNTRAVMTTGSIICDGSRGYHAAGWFSSEYYYWDIDKCSGTITMRYDDDRYIIFRAPDYDGGGIISTIDGRYKDLNGNPVYWTPWYGAETFNVNSYGIEEPQEDQTFLGAFKSSRIYTEYFPENLKYFWGNMYSDPVVTVTATAVSSVTVTAGTNPNSKYKFFSDNGLDAAHIATQAYTGGYDGVAYLGGGTVNGENFTRAWWPAAYKYSLYYTYLHRMIEEYGEDHISLSECSETRPSSTYFIKNSPSEYCKIDLDSIGTGALGTTLAVVDQSTGKLHSGTFADVLNWFNTESNYEHIDDDGYLNATITNGQITGGTSIGADGDADPEEQTAESVCYSSAGPLGWIICPALIGIDSMTDWLYDVIERNFIQVDPRFTFTDDTPTHQAWNGMRNIANVIFIGFLLIIIISQVTGYGIDNYGIKRMLPKLIVGAVMVNSSFIFTQLSVDLSNIVGGGVTGLFNSIINTNGMSAAGASGGVGIGIMTGVLGVGVAGGLGIALSNGLISIRGIILFLFLGAISIAGAVVFLFALLIARQVSLILLTILAPLALVLYMLPNTQAVFKRWLGAMKGLLVLYPVCSVVVGGGNFAGIVLSRIGEGMEEWGWLYTLAAMLVQVIPFFFIPMLLRSSLKAIGNIGSSLSGIGRGLTKNVRGFTDKAVRDSRGFKNSEQKRLDTKEFRRANRDRRRIEKRMDRGKSLSASDARRYQAAAGIIASNDADLIGAQIGLTRSSLSASSLEARAQGYRDTEEDKATRDQEALVRSSEAFKNNDFDGMATEYRKAAKSGDADRARAYQNVLMETDKGRAKMLDSFAQIYQDSAVGNDTKTALLQDLRGKHATKLKTGGNRSAYDELNQKNPADIDVRRLQVEHSGESVASAATKAGGDYGKALQEYSDGTKADYSHVNTDNYSFETLVGSDDIELDKLMKLSADADLLDMSDADATAKLSAAQQAHRNDVKAKYNTADKKKALLAQRDQLASVSQKAVAAINSGRIQNVKGETVKRLQMLAHTATPETTTIHLRSDGAGGLQGDLPINH